MAQATTILMVEDSASLVEVYKAYLAETDCQVIVAETLRDAHVSLASFQPDVVLLDIELPDGSGLEFLADLKLVKNPPEVIVMTAHATSDMAVKAIGLGALDFLTKPFDAARLRVTLDNAIAQRQLGRRVDELASMERDHFGDFIGRSPAMQSVYKTIDSLAASDATGFIVGESGTGKELAAEAIHRYSDRSDKPFIAINCGAIPSELMESELFGHVKGAFTGASSHRDGAATISDGGTLFLDEICEMSLVLQKKLLRFIQTGTFRKVGSNTLEKVDVRFVCSTNLDPLEEVREGRFREDLFYRLHVVPVRMPPLRERDGDMLMIARHFLDQFSAKQGRAFRGFTPGAEQVITRYAWPGNVRQLQNAMQQLVVLHDGDLVEVDMLPEQVTSGHIEPEQAPPAPATVTVFEAAGRQGIHNHLERRQRIEPLWLTEKQAIEAAIEVCDGNVNQAAGLLEVAPSTVYRKIQGWKKQRA